MNIDLRDGAMQEAGMRLKDVPSDIRATFAVALNKRPTLFFCHIPKTAGTSVRTSIERAYPDFMTAPNRRQMKADRGRYPEWSGVDLSRCRLLRGHYPLSAADALRGAVIVTVLRDPVERAISALRHMITAHGLTDERMHADLRDGRFPARDNMMVRMLSAPASERFDNWDYDFQTRFEPATRDDLERARANLDRIDVLGVVEDMSRFARALRERTGIDFDPDDVRRVETAELKVDGRERAVIEAHNALDRELYDAALERLAP